MKKVVVLVVLIALFLVVSCDSGIKFDNPLDEHNQDAQTDAGTLGKECYRNKTCNEGLICDEETNTCIEESATEPTEDPTEEPTTEPTEEPTTEPTEEPTEELDTRTADCSSKPDNTVWNDNGANGTFTQTWNGEAWGPASYASTYNETAGICHYKCISEEYTWTGSACTSSGSSTLPECSTADVTPCYDSTSHLTWSKKSGSSMSYNAAESYCSGSEMNGYGGYTDWRLPNISELRTLVKNCPATQFPQIGEESCGITYPDHLSNSNDWDDACRGCTYDDNNLGQYSKFGDTWFFWSSSILSDDSNYAWEVSFSSGKVGYDDITLNDNSVRCVR